MVRGLGGTPTLIGSGEWTRAGRQVSGGRYRDKAGAAARPSDYGVERTGIEALTISKTGYLMRPRDLILWS